MLHSDRPNALPTPPGWRDPLRRFELHLAALNRSHRTITTRLTHLATAARALGTASPSEVTSEDLEVWCGSAQWAPETRHAYYSSLRTFFRWLYRENPEEDPSQWLPSIHRPIPPPRPAPDSAISEAIAKAHPRTRLILELAAELGLRAGEIATLNTTNLTDTGDGWTTLTVEGKGGQIRVLPVSPALTAQIRRQQGPNGWVFPGNINGHLSPRWVGTLATKVLPEPWTLHTLRHRFATVAYNAGTKDLVAVQHALGHKSITTTQRYTQTSLDLKDLMTTTKL